MRAAGPRGEPTQVGGLSWGSSMDAGWWLARDLDHDGRDEILVVGDTDGVASSSLSVLGWGQDVDGQGAMLDRLWRALQQLKLPR